MLILKEKVVWQRQHKMYLLRVKRVSGFVLGSQQPTEHTSCPHGICVLVGKVDP